MELQKIVKEALTVLHNHQGNAVRATADRWLKNLQRTTDAWQLPLEAFQPLRDSLYALLKKFCKGPPKVTTQICTGIAALAVHASVENWGDGGIVNWISNAMRTHSEYIPGLLELLTVLSEEAYNYRIAARPERRRRFEKELVSSVEIVFSLLTTCLNCCELKYQEVLNCMLLGVWNRQKESCWNTPMATAVSLYSQFAK